MQCIEAGKIVSATEPTDDELVRRAQHGSETAFNELVQRHHRRALRVALSVVSCFEQAEDVVQEAFLRAYKQMHRFQGGSSFYTWFYRIVVNAGIDTVRKSRRERRACLEDQTHFDKLAAISELWPTFDGNHPESTCEQRELRERIGRAFSQLGEIHRAVLVLREVEGQSYEEIAATLGIKKGTVMSRLFHARRAMQRHLGGPAPMPTPQCAAA